MNNYGSFTHQVTCVWFCLSKNVSACNNWLATVFHFISKSKVSEPAIFQVLQKISDMHLILICLKYFDYIYIIFILWLLKDTSLFLFSVYALTYRQVWILFGGLKKMALLILVNRSTQIGFLGHLNSLFFPSVIFSFIKQMVYHLKF